MLIQMHQACHCADIQGFLGYQTIELLNIVGSKRLFEQRLVQRIGHRVAKCQAGTVFGRLRSPSIDKSLV